MNHNLRLYWGENYYPKPEKVQLAIKQASKKAIGLLHLYPGKWQQKLKSALAQEYEVDTSQLLLENGIEGLIHLIIRIFMKKGDKVAMLLPTFPVCQIACDTYGLNTVQIPVQIGQVFTATSLFSIIKKTSLFYLAYPNNPTGHYILYLKGLEKLLDIYKGTVILDECYYGIGNQTALSLLKKHQNIIILRSFSKTLGLAGLRFGFAISHKQNINILEKFSSQIEVDQLNIFSCLLALEILPLMDCLVKGFVKYKNDFENLLKLYGFHIIKSDTSFIMIFLDNNLRAQNILSALKKKYKILFKDTSIYQGFPDNILMLAVPSKKYWNFVATSLRRVICTEKL